LPGYFYETGREALKRPRSVKKQGWRRYKNPGTGEKKENCGKQEGENWNLEQK